MPEKLLCRCGYTSISKWAFYIVFSDCYTHSKSEDNNVIFDNESWGMSMNQNLYPHLFQPLTEVTESDWQKECRQARAVRILKTLKTLKKLKNRVTCFRCEAHGIHPNLPRRNMGTAYQNTMRKSLVKMCRIETERIATPVVHMLYLTYAETMPDLGYDSNGGQRL